MRDRLSTELTTVHSVVDCDLTAPTLDCKATAVIGPDGRTFYVSGNAVYLWVNSWNYRRGERRGGPDAFVYRLPLDGSEAPSAIVARGNPTDQFSFREDRSNGLLDVLVREEGRGDSMAGSEVSAGAVTLVSIPVRAFGDGSGEVAQDRFRPLPHPGRNSWSLQNRFVGNHLLYSGSDFQGSRPGKLVVAGLRGGPVTELQLPHAVTRIDQLGRDGVAIGSDPAGALRFSAIDLSRGLPHVGDEFVMPAAGEGESRSQAFFFRPDNDDGTSGLLGLPISRRVEPRFQRLFGRSASILFLKREQRRFGLAGELGARVEGALDDNCRASCSDWYGNARPIFWDGGRLFALLGYELIEGRYENGRIGEVARVDFTPSAKAAVRP